MILTCTVKMCARTCTCFPGAFHPPPTRLCATRSAAVCDMAPQPPSLVSPAAQRAVGSPHDSQHANGGSRKDMLQNIQQAAERSAKESTAARTLQAAARGRQARIVLPAHAAYTIEGCDSVLCTPATTELSTAELQASVNVQPPQDTVEMQRRKSINKSMKMLGVEAEGAATVSVAVGEANEKAMLVPSLSMNTDSVRSSSAIKGATHAASNAA